MGAAYNGLKQYKEALEVLEEFKDSKDPLVKVEYKKAFRALAEKNKPSEDQKDTYSKMFDPKKRKEEEQKRKEEKQKQKKKDEEEMQEKEDKKEKKGEDGFLTYAAITALALLGGAAILYKALKK